MRGTAVVHDAISVTFQSQSEHEIAAIQDCFGYFQWQAPSSVPSSQGWSVISQQVSSLDVIAGPAYFTQTAPLYKEQSLVNAIIAGTDYYRHSIGSTDCLTVFDRGERQIHFYRVGEVGEHSYIRNLVREPVAAHYKRVGHLLMHASACAIGDRAVIMPGLKGAGKSTLLCHLLAQGANFIANDAVLCLREPDNAVRLTAYPQCVRLSRETINANRLLKAYFDRPHHHPFIKAKYEFLPSVFDQVFQSHCLTSSADLAAVIVPALDLARTDYAITRGSMDEARQVLRQSMFYLCHDYVWSPAFDDLNDPALDLQAFEYVFGVDLPVFRLDYGILDENRQRAMFREIAEIIHNIDRTKG
jgi:hypothetical protein